MSRRLRGIIIAALGITASLPLFAGDLKPQSRLTLVRALMAEYATVNSPLPRGEKGLRLEIEGGIDQKSLGHEITQHGTAVPAHTLVQITNLEFKDREILLEINGGGQRKSKWYEHIEVGIGNGTQPLSGGKNAGTPTGSQIALVFPQNLPDLTVEQVKTYLSPVLDFHPVTPLQTMTRPFPPEFQKAVEEKRAEVGMNQDMVLAALGPPDQRVRETKEGVENEDWIYGTPPMKVTFVTFRGDEVVHVEEYTGGVRGQSESPLEDPPR
ncbi:MAG: hypothetical protein HY647_07540 [Acidobacteria bacterium]|nr:hypothetical protein [Acidobacteriota bacterium]